MEEANKWLEKSGKDLEAAEINLKENLYEVCAFLSHQAAEKALKALYILKYKKLWKIHDLYELGKKISAPKEILDLCEKLNPHYIATRYPAEAEYTEEIASSAFKFSKRLVEWSRKMIKSIK